MTTLHTDNVEEFILSLRKFADQVPEKHSAIVRKTAMQVLRGVVMKTPVDTGRAKGNWSVTNGQPTLMQVEGTDKTGNVTIRTGLSQILEAKPQLEIIWIQNNLPYIVPLEHGHSQQAAKGMLAVTIAEVKEGLA